MLECNYLTTVCVEEEKRYLNYCHDKMKCLSTIFPTHRYSAFGTVIKYFGFILWLERFTL